MEQTVPKPKKRSRLRKIAGREFYILKRRLEWIRFRNRYATRPNNITDKDECKYSVIRHHSMLLRPLKDVDMILQHNKVKNLSLAIRKIDGIVIRPGELFSFWHLVGRPTRSKGYLEGLVLDNGRISRGTGGGMCQMGNLLYWMVLHTDMEITERWRHSYDVFPDVNRTIPFACGATLSFNYIDLGFINRTPFTYRIKLWLDDENLNGEIFCDTQPQHLFQVVETDYQFRQQWWGGYTRHNIIHRRRHDSDGSTHTELVSENHAILMYRPFLES